MFGDLIARLSIEPTSVFAVVFVQKHLSALAFAFGALADSYHNSVIFTLSCCWLIGKVFKFDTIAFEQQVGVSERLIYAFSADKVDEEFEIAVVGSQL